MLRTHHFVQVPKLPLRAVYEYSVPWPDLPDLRTDFYGEASAASAPGIEGSGTVCSRGPSVRTPWSWAQARQAKRDETTNGSKAKAARSHGPEMGRVTAGTVEQDPEDKMLRFIVCRANTVVLQSCT